jgi:putative ABC transport system permease protein
MFRNYLVSAFRQLQRNRFYSAINIVGFTLGLSAAALTILYARHELSYDNFFRQPDRIYRVSAKLTNEWFAQMAVPYSNSLCRKPFAEIQQCARVSQWATQFIKYGDKKLSESKIMVTDPGSEFFSIFNFRFIEGDQANALAAPHSVVITSSLARELFGSNRAVGQLIRYDTIQLAVTGVIEDIPSNSQFDFRFFFTDKNIMADEIGAAYTYCLLAPGTNIPALKKKMMAQVQSLPKPADPFSIVQDIAIIPLKDIHFWEGFKFELKPAGNKLYLYLFITIGAMIVLLSGMNYMNLSIAMYVNRKKEIAVRKVAGAANAQLATQFTLEAICLSLICLPLTLLVIQLILPFFNRLMDLHLSNEFIASTGGFALLVAVTLLLGFLSGSYPAWVLPRLKAISLFKKEMVSGRSGLTLRQGLVTFQMSVLVLMLSASWMVRRQLHFIQEKDLGFSKEGVLKIKNAWRVDSSSFFYLKNELLTNPAVKSVSQGYAPGDEDYGMSFRADGSYPVNTGLISIHVDYDYLQTMGIRLLASADSNRNRTRRLILINQTLARQLGYKDPIGKKIVLDPGKSDEFTREIGGVFQDFNFFSLHQAVPPMLLSMGPRFGQGVNNNILIKIGTEHIAQTLAFIRQKTAEIVPGIDVNYEFIDDSLSKLYNKEQKLSLLNGVLLSVDIFLSLLGLIGLAAYMNVQRNKEIGIRKVLGASVPDILLLLSGSFLKMAGIAILAGSALSLLYIRQWLDNFAYKTPISWMVFADTAGLLLLVILVTAGIQALRAALVNPVKNLRVD